MPKYYRFRATTPTRKPKRKETKDCKRAKGEAGERWWESFEYLGPATSWYLRRTAWREPPTIPFEYFTRAGTKPPFSLFKSWIFSLK